MTAIKSDFPVISADGRVVAFLVSEIITTPAAPDRPRTEVFVQDLDSGAVSRISFDGGAQSFSSYILAPALSAEGRHVAFAAFVPVLDGENVRYHYQVFVHDRDTGSAAPVSVASGGALGTGVSWHPDISADGRFVVFDSLAPDLVPGDTNLRRDVFVHDRETGSTSRVSLDPDGAQMTTESAMPSISADGRFVAFVSGDFGGDPGHPAHRRPEIYVHDRETGSTAVISVDPVGDEANDRSFHPRISADGWFVTFQSYASNLVPGDTNGVADIFVHDRQTGVTTRVSVDGTGAQANGQSTFPRISADGRFVTFESYATNLFADDTNGLADIFVHDRLTGATTRISGDGTGAAVNGIDGGHPSVSADGRLVAFARGTPDLSAQAGAYVGDIYIHDRDTGTTTRIPTPDFTLTAPAHDLSIRGSEGDDTIRGGSMDDVIHGGGGNDLILGGAGHDLIHGDGGNDTIFGNGGNDTIHGGDGDDSIGAGAGDDLIHGGAGDDIIWGSLGNDTIHGDEGNDTLHGGGDGANRIYGGAGDDLIHGGTGGDVIEGGTGNDTIRGHAGDDTIHGGEGDDNIGGGAGDDEIYGTAGNNLLWGGEGDDRIHSGTGRDVMNGGPGEDVFVFASAAHIGIRETRDRIADFTPGEDLIDLSALETQFNGTAGLLGGGIASFYHYLPRGLLIGDQTGNGVADWVIELPAVDSLGEADFIL